ncbi:MAG: metal-sulfur cluster assembly factor [Thermoplasmata archaeon]
MPNKEEVIEELKNVVDPHTGTDVYNMGLISDLEVKDDSVSLTFTPTSPFCPMGVQLAVQIKKNLSQIDDLDTDGIDITVEGHMQSDQINEKLASGEL